MGRVSFQGVPVRPAAVPRRAATVPAVAAPAPRAACWRERLCRQFAPNAAMGLPLGHWLALLAENRCRIAPAYLPRAAVTTVLSLLTSICRPLDWLVYGRAVAAQTVLPPLFVLGHWRSGTTHLHNLLTIDERFAFARLSEVMIPHTFLASEASFRAVARRLIPPTRFGVDNVAFSLDVPFEEEFALAQLTGLSPYLAWAFPQRERHYGRFLTFEEASPAQVRRWQAAFVLLLKKLTVRHRRPLILKSPPNTARIRLLLEMFPDARFVHIARNPYEVYRSTLRLHEKSTRSAGFQHLDRATLHARVLRQYRELYDAYFAQRSLIPAGRLVELTYEELEADPVGQVAAVYQGLNLPDFTTARPAVERYLDSVSGYQKNQHRELPPALRDEIATAWQQSFDEWGYLP